MAHAYTPGLKVIPCTVLRKRRVLPIPGKVFPVNIANRLSVTAGEIPAFLLKRVGDPVKKGEIVAENKPFIKWFKTSVESPITGTVDSVSEVTGQMLLREPPKVLPLLSYIKGKVVEVHPGFGVTVETEGTFIQGIFGIGGETNGPIAMAVETPDEELTPGHIKDEHKGRVVIGGKHAGLATIKRAIEAGVHAIVVGGIHDRDLRQILGYDIGVAVTGTEKIGLTLIVTEGFGMIPMADYTFRLLASRNGETASVSGATQIRAGVMRPEIIVPGYPKDVKECKREEGRGWIEPGDPVRIIREPHFGVIGTVLSLPPELTKCASESHVRVLEVQLADGTKLTVPRANIEVLEK